MKKTYQRGSVYLDRRRGIWYFRWREDGRRKAEQIGTAAEYPTKATNSPARMLNETSRMTVGSSGL